MSAYRDNQRAALHADEDFARGVLKTALGPEETMVWANRPKRGLLYEPYPNMFVNLVWTLVSLVWACSGFITNVSFALGLLAIPFVLVGLHGLFWRHLVDAWRRRDLVYGLTNRRLLIATPKGVVSAMALEQLRTRLIIKPDGVGRIRVVAPRCELRAVPNAEDVHRLLTETQAALESPESAAPSSAAPESVSQESAGSARGQRGWAAG